HRRITRAPSRADLRRTTPSGAGDSSWTTLTRGRCAESRWRHEIDVGGFGSAQRIRVHEGCLRPRSARASFIADPTAPPVWESRSLGGGAGGDSGAVIS